MHYSLKFVCTLRLSRTLAPHNDLESGSRTGSDFDGSFESDTGDQIPSSFRRLASVDGFQEPHFTEELFLVNGSSVEPNLVVVGGEVDFPNGDGDHGLSSWPVTEDNSLGSGYGDDRDDDSSFSGWSVIEDGSSVEPNLVVVGGEVDFPNGDGDHGLSSWPVTEDNSKRGGCHLVMATIGMTILAFQVGL